MAEAEWNQRNSGAKTSDEIEVAYRAELKEGDSMLTSIADCEKAIAELEDRRWPWLMEAVRQGVEKNKRQYLGVQHAAEIINAIDQDYLSVLQSILATAEMHAADSIERLPAPDAPNAEDFDLGDQGQSGG